MYCKECGKLLVYDNAILHYGKKLTADGITFISKRIYSNQTFNLCRCQECANKKFPEISLKKNIFACKFSKVVQYIFDVPDDIFKQYVHERQALTEEKMINIYGKELGLEKWNAYRQKQSITNTFEYKQEKYGITKKEFDEYNKSRASTKELFIKRHGIEEGTKLWDEYCERQRYTTSLEYFIEKHGKDDGLKIYENFDHGRTTFGGASKIADLFFEDLIKDKIFENHEIYFNGHPIEYCIDGYRLDFYDKTLNLVIEFYGDLWHCNPKKFKANNIFIHPFTKEQITPQDIWNKDNIRKNNIIKKLNCKFIIIWESEIKKSNKKKLKTIDKIINIIKNEILINEQSTNS